MAWITSLLDISLATANRFYAWGWGLSASGAAITVLGIGLLWWGTRVRDHDFEHSMATLHKQAGVFEKEAANARLETERLKGVVAWRVVSDAAALELEKVLAASPGAVNLRYTDGDPEALFLAIQIGNILGKAKWQVGSGSYKPANTIIFGIVLPDATSTAGKVLQDALTAAKLPFVVQPLPPTGMSVSFGVVTIPNAPLLLIGSRSPPRFQ
jgi:hypothetical protein